MKKELNYVAPDLEVIEVMVEAGFATSLDAPGLGTSDYEDNNDYNNGGWN